MVELYVLFKYLTTMMKVIFRYKESFFLQIRMTVRLVSHHENVLKQMEMDNRFNWLIKRFLLICLHRLYDSDTNLNEFFLTTVHVFAKNSSVLEYLIRKG